MFSRRFHLAIASSIVLVTAIAVLVVRSSPPDGDWDGDEDRAPAGQAVDPDHHWLPNLTGLITDWVDADPKAEIKAAPIPKDQSCSKIPAPLRAMTFRHFENYQAMQNAQGVRLSEKEVDKWGHVLAMIVKESSGDATDVTDMRGRDVGTGEAKTSLDRWSKLYQRDVRYNVQTNFGLAQMSADRLRLTFSLPETAHLSFLDRISESLGHSFKLDTSIAARRLIWLYQDFAQGRISQHDSRIKEKDVAANLERHRLGLKHALYHCGTRFMYKEGYQGEAGERALEKAMESIAYCKIGKFVTHGKKNDQGRAVYGQEPANMKCFAQWVTLCPALNFDIALLAPDKYFQTRKEKPVCSDTFQNLLK